MRDVSPVAPRPSLVPYHPQQQEALHEGACERECLRPSGSTAGVASPAAAIYSPSAACMRGGAAAPSYGSTGSVASSGEGRRRRGPNNSSSARPGTWLELVGSLRNVFRPAAYFSGWRSEGRGAEGGKQGRVQVLPYEPLKKKTTLHRRGSLVRWLLSRGFVLGAAAVLCAVGLLLALLFWLGIRGPSVTGRLQSGQSVVLRADPRYFKALLVRESSGSSSAPPLSLYTSLTKPQPSTQLRLHTLPDAQSPALTLEGGQSTVLSLRDPTGAPIKAVDLDFRATGADVWLWLLRPDQLSGFTNAFLHHSLPDQYSPQTESSPLPLHPNALATQYGTWVPVRASVEGSPLLYVVLHNPASKAQARVHLSSITLSAAVSALDLSRAHPLPCGPTHVALRQDNTHEADKHTPHTNRALRSSPDAMSLRCRASLDTLDPPSLKPQDKHRYVVVSAPSVDDLSMSSSLSSTSTEDDKDPLLYSYSYTFHVSKVLGPVGKGVLLGLAMGPLCLLLLALGALLVVDKLSGPSPYSGLYALDRRHTAATLSDASLSSDSSGSSYDSEEEEEEEDEDRVAPWQKERIGAPPGGFPTATPTNKDTTS